MTAPRPDAKVVVHSDGGASVDAQALLRTDEAKRMREIAKKVVDAKVSRERIEEIVALHAHCMSGGHIRLLADELLAARERIAKLEEEREGLREVVVEAFDEWLYAAGYKGDYLMEKHGDVERVAELRAKIGRNADGTWADSALAKQGGETE